MRVNSSRTSPSLDPSAPMQVVVVRGMLSPDGALSEMEVLASTDSSLDQVAVDQVKKPPRLSDGIQTAARNYTAGSRGDLYDAVCAAPASKL